MKTVARFWVLAVMLICASDRLSGQERPVRKRMDYLDNGIIKVGVDLERGGSIGFLADSKDGENVVNVHDLGRWIGQSYYSGPKPFGVAHPGWKDWPWNPVSAGDVYGNASRLLDQTNDGKILYVKSIPMQWALKATPGDCTFETWIELHGRTVRVRNRLTNQRADETQYAAMDQELPAVYTIGKFYRLMTYTGDRPFTEMPLTQIPNRPMREGRPQWSTFDATEHWAAFVNDDDWGVGVLHPGIVHFLGGFAGRPNVGGSNDDPTSYLAPVRKEILDQNIIYEYRYTLVLDTLTNIRKEACLQRPKEAVPDYRFTNDRQHCWLLNAHDTGVPLKEFWRLKLEQNDPQIMGPEGNWPAKDAPTIFIRAAYRTTKKTAELFWETTERPGFTVDQRMKFPIVPDGEFRTYEVNLSSSPTYQGTIRKLRFDPVDAGNPGETMDLEFISAVKR